MPDNKIDKAYELFKSGMSLKDISDQLGVSPATVRSWKSRNKWSGSEQTKKETVTQRDATQRNRKRKAAANMLQPLLENDGLTERQKLFCIYFVKSFNATKSYQKAFDCAYTTAMTEGSRALVNPKIKFEIARLKKEKALRAYLEPGDIIEEFMKIAFSDIGDYLEWGMEWQPYVDKGKPVLIRGTDGSPVISGRDVNVAKLREADDVDTSLVTEIKQGKDGFSVKLLDKQRALEWLAEHMGLATDEQKARIELVKAQTDKIKGTGNDIEDLDDIRGAVYGDEE